MSEGALRWIREEFPSQLINAIGIKRASPETYESTLKETIETLARVIGQDTTVDIFNNLVQILHSIVKEARQ